MLELFYYFLLVLALTLALAALVLRAPAHTATKTLALILAALLLGSAYFAGTALLGRPKPARLAILEKTANEATVVASMNVEGEAIFLWLILPDQTMPRAYSLPWSQKTAEALRRAQSEARGNGTQARMRRPFQGSAANTEAQFFAPPPPPMPPKS